MTKKKTYLNCLEKILYCKWAIPLYQPNLGSALPPPLSWALNLTLLTYNLAKLSSASVLKAS